MTNSEMAEHTAERSILLTARLAGVLWLMVIVAGVFALGVGSSLMAGNDAAATAANILAHESLFRVSCIAELIAGLCYLGVTGLLYTLLRPVSRGTSLLAAFFGLGGVAIGGASFLSRFAPLVILHADPTLSSLSGTQLQAMAQMALKLYLVGVNMGMVFFGIQCLLLGYLIIRATFLPHLLGVLLAIGGSTYLISSFSSLVAPTVGARLLPLIAVAGLVGEGSLTFWLIARGVNLQSWRKLQAAAGSRL